MKLLFVAHHRRLRLSARGEPWARELARRGHDVTSVCIAQTRRLRLVETMQDGVRYVETPDLLWGTMRSGWDPWDTLRRVRYLRGRRYDVVHAFETRPATIHPVLSLLRSAPAPLVIDWIDWWGRGGLIRDRRPRWYQILFGPLETWYEEHFRSRANHSTVISTALARRAESLGIPADAITVIPGGVDPAVFPVRPPVEHRRRFGLPDDRFVAFFAAADAVMDLELVLRSVAEAAPRIPRLLLAMTGHVPARFERRVRDAGVADRVRHLGYLPYRDLPMALSCADVFLLPFSDTVANRGRWPHKIGEYMACGRPTISNPTGDIRVLFERDRVGMLVDPTPAAMAGALLSLFEDPVLRADIGATARRVAEGRFDWRRIVDRVEGVYERVAREWPSGGAGGAPAPRG